MNIAEDIAVEESAARYGQNRLEERTYLFARRIVRLYSSLPSSTLAQTLGKQLLRSGTSIGANHREACRARSRAEFVSLLGICLREASETEYWLDLLADEEIVKPDRLGDLREEAHGIVATLIASINSTKRNQKENKTLHVKR